MRKLYESLPDSVTVNGKRYKLYLDFKNVLRMLEIIGQDDLTPAARDWYALRCVLKKNPPRKYQDLLAAVMRLLFGTNKKTDGERLTSFEQDADLIRAAFWQEYGINLYRDDLHWFEFQALVQNLPSGNRYTDVIGIRAQETPTANKYNQKEREALIRAKSYYALELTPEEQRKRYEGFTHRAFAGLSAIAKEVKE